MIPSVGKCQQNAHFHVQNLDIKALETAEDVTRPVSQAVAGRRYSWQHRGIGLHGGKVPQVSYKGDLHQKIVCTLMPADNGQNNQFVESKKGNNQKREALKLLQDANIFLPPAIMAATALALVFPPSFTWFTTRYYAPALGFLMFAVGINLNAEDFVRAFKRPSVILLGYAGQYILKPLLGVVVAFIAVSCFHLPHSISSGLILVSCVSGAQLSNYATYLVMPSMAPLSIVMTALSTATAVLVTPALTLLLLGRRLPVDVQGMMTSIMQIVIAPIAAGLALNRFASPVSKAIRPFLPFLSVLVTSCCVGAPLAINIGSVLSTIGFTLLLLVIGLHAAAFALGYKITKILFSEAPDVDDLAKTISFETGMQSSLLGLALANRFFPDPLVGLPCALSVVVMSLMGFGLVMWWSNRNSV
ncbi:hypothetical protein O6H91_13G007500 [Diphasiastrum complanatum]|uniref:Uncharacterized protein n=1 Tax=Diphasiastrum complanatum TaxID=34168 RepID=A0ACC2BSM3_DIPCM|nr:hypothetical protein O6H91_13G007500 [Diphasiastrum complanatum]